MNAIKNTAVWVNLWRVRDMHDIGKAVEKTIISDITLIKGISTEIVKKLEGLQADPSDIFDIKLCVEEALRNAIEHGNAYDKNKKVNLRYAIDDGCFSMTISDEGEGFDVHSVPNPVKKENLLKAGGRGVYLISRLMDRAEYSNKGRELTIQKRFLKGKDNGA